MSANQFFKSKGPIPLDVILKHIKSNSEVDSNFDILGIQDLKNANTKDISFLHSIKYKEDLNNTKAFACVTSKDLAKYIPKRCKIVIVNNVLFAVTQISKLFYPNSDFDHLDASLKKSSDVKNKYPKVSFGINVLIGSGVKIGQDSFVASNSIIESNVVIGSNCVIGSFVVIRNAIIEDEVHIQDGSVVGKSGI